MEGQGDNGGYLSQACPSNTVTQWNTSLYPSCEAIGSLYYSAPQLAGPQEPTGVEEPQQSDATMHPTGVRGQLLASVSVDGREAAANIPLCASHANQWTASWSSLPGWRRDRSDGGAD